MAPPTTIAPTKVNGNSRATAGCEAKSADFFCPDACAEVSSCLLSEGILGELGERLRIQPGGESDKHGDGEGHSLRAGHHGTGRFAGLLEPGVHDDAEIVVERGNDVKNGEDGEHGMVRLDQRKENEILAHEAGGGRDARERKHEDQEQDCGGGAALVKTVQVVELFANDALLAKDDDYGKGAGGHEDVGEQVVGNSGESGFVPGNESEKDVADMRDGGIREEALHVGLGERSEVAPGERSYGDTRDDVHPLFLGSLFGRRKDRNKKSQKQSKTRRLGSNADIGGNGRGCAFVNVWRPLMKRHCGDFEEQAHGYENEGENRKKLESERIEVQCDGKLPGQHLARGLAWRAGEMAERNDVRQPLTKSQCIGDGADVCRATKAV